jgi:hypothetical protein
MRKALHRTTLKGAAADRTAYSLYTATRASAPVLKHVCAVLLQYSQQNTPA